MPLPLSVDRTSFVEVPGLTASALNDLFVPSTDVSDFRWFSLTIVGASHVGQLSWQASNDDFVSNPVRMYVYQLNVPSAYYQNATNVGSDTQIFHGPFFARFFRVIQNAYTGGSVTGTLELYKDSSYPGTINAIQTGRWALGAAINSNMNCCADFHLVSAGSNNASVIKNSTGLVYGYDIYNANTVSTRYVKLYNKSSAPSPASDTALLIRTIAIPSDGKATYHSTTGIAGFSSGIALATVTGIADNDNTAVGASDLVIDIDYSPS